MRLTLKTIGAIGLAFLLAASAIGALAAALAGSMNLPLAPDVPMPAGTHLQVTIAPRLVDIFAGEAVNFTVTIVNDGAVTVSDLNSSGTSLPNCNRSNLGTLDPGQTASYSCQKTGVSASSLEILSVTGSVAASGDYTQKADAFIRVSKPDLIILKRPTFQTVRQGDTARFSIVIRNEGTSALTNVKVLDTAAPDCGLDPVIPLNLAPGERREYTCRLDDVAAPVAAVATFQGTNPGDGSINQVSDIAWVDVLDLGASLQSDPPAVSEPGAEVTFTVSITNPGSIPLTLTGLTTNKYGNLFDPGNELVPASTNECLPGLSPIAVPPYGGGVSCDFVAPVGGQPSDFSVILTALAKSADDEQVSATTSATVPILDVPAEIELNLSANPPVVNAPSGNVKFTVRITNISEADGVIIDELTDATVGNLDGKGNCSLPTELIITGGVYECTYTDRVIGEAGDSILRTVSAAGVTDDPFPGPVAASDTITLPITDLPVQKILMPSIIDDVVEPNDTCNRAYPLQLNRKYFFLPPPTYHPPPNSPQDYFVFLLDAPTEVVVEMTNFVPRAGQLIVRKGEDCRPESLETVGISNVAALNRTLDLGTQGPGQYFIQVVSDGPPELKELYGLIVRTE